MRTHKIQHVGLQCLVQNNYIYRLSKAPPFESRPGMKVELIHQQEHQHSYACRRHRVVFRRHSALDVDN